MNEQTQTNKWASKNMHPETEAQALYDHFNGKVPHEGGNVAKIFAFFEGRPHIHQNDWKPIFEMALKIQQHEATRQRRA